MKQKAPCLMTLLAALTIGAENDAAAAALFAEDFESYPVASNLVGQNGWFGGADPVVTSDSGPLPTRVLDGLNSISGSFFGLARHFIPSGLPAGGVSTMSFDAFGSNPGSHNAWIGLSNGNDGINIVSLSNAVTWEFDRNGGWAFRIRQSTAQFLTTSVGGANTLGKFSIIVDPTALEAWGIYDFGSGAAETTRFAVAAETLAALDAVNIGFDFRGTHGIQIDNILVSTVPLPPTLWLLGAAMACLKMRRRTQPE